MKILEVMSGKKTYFFAALTVIAAFYLFATGGISVEQFIQLLATAGIGAGLRSALNN